MLTQEKTSRRDQIKAELAIIAASGRITETEFKQIDKLLDELFEIQKQEEPKNATA